MEILIFLALCAGIASIVVGVAMLSLPAALIVLGVMMAATAIALVRVPGDEVRP